MRPNWQGHCRERFLIDAVEVIAGQGIHVEESASAIKGNAAYDQVIAKLKRPPGSRTTETDLKACSSDQVIDIGCVSRGYLSEAGITPSMSLPLSKRRLTPGGAKWPNLITKQKPEPQTR